mmetsp:Transcript_14514/g.36998  ORF Transcript_14514/g.36998 Transcript_14514/m.36998 type:complete len:233 (-) Transcript_14514:583-1281(-)
MDGEDDVGKDGGLTSPKVEGLRRQERVNQSPLWEIFKRVGDNVQCHVDMGGQPCRAQIRHDAKSGTSNLWRHLKHRHEEIFATLRDQSTQVAAVRANKQKREERGYDSGDLDSHSPSRKRRSSGYGRGRRSSGSPVFPATMGTHALIAWAFDGDSATSFRVVSDLEARNIDLREVKEKISELLLKLSRGEMVTDGSQLTPTEKKLEEMEEMLRNVAATSEATYGIVKSKFDS